MNDPVAEPQGSVRVFRDRFVVRHENDRRAVSAAHLIEQIEHLLAGRRVESPGRLVGEQELRLVRESASDCDALALAAGEDGWTRVQATLQADLA